MVLITNCRDCIETAGDYLRKAFNATANATREAAIGVFELASKILAIAIPTFLFFGFPGSFIAGVGIGFIFPEHTARTIHYIRRSWENQAIFAPGTLFERCHRAFVRCAAIFTFFYGLPYTPYMAAALSGAHLGSQQALSVMFRTVGGIAGRPFVDVHC